MSFGSIRRGAYTDSKGIRWDPNDADYEGILYKQSRWMRGLFYFILFYCFVFILIFILIWSIYLI